MGKVAHDLIKLHQGGDCAFKVGADYLRRKNRSNAI